MEVGSTPNGIKQLEDGFKKKQYLDLALGLFIFGISVYAFSLSIKVNKLSLRKMKDEGYE